MGGAILLLRGEVEVVVQGMAASSPNGSVADEVELPVDVGPT